MLRELRWLKADLRYKWHMKRTPEFNEKLILFVSFWIISLIFLFFIYLPVSDLQYKESLKPQYGKILSSYSNCQRIRGAEYCENRVKVESEGEHHTLVIYKGDPNYNHYVVGETYNLRKPYERRELASVTISHLPTEIDSFFNPTIVSLLAKMLIFIHIIVNIYAIGLVIDYFRKK